MLLHGHGASSLGSWFVTFLMWLRQLVLSPKDVSNDCTVEAAMEKDYNLIMGFADGYVCAFCDEGGKLIQCEGDCKRYFHATKLEGKHSKCETLGLSEEQVKELVFLCKNCEYKQHQCVVCGDLRSSDRSSDFKYVAVFQCNKKGCKRFYHPECLDRADRDLNTNPEDFECPLHECLPCKNKGRKATPEGIEETGMHLVQCRRCPKAYHRKCLPRRDLHSRTWKIGDLFCDGSEKTGELTLFYCKDHKIVKRLRSATRDHLKFPGTEGVENGTGMTKKRSVPEGQVDAANKESDPVLENRDKIPRTHKGNPAPEQAEAPQHTWVEHNAGTGSGTMESLAPNRLLSGLYPSEPGKFGN
ncbi:unnamed protein product [Alopecurus aequalis]